MEKRQNDIMMAMIANPNATIANFVEAGYTPENTSLQDISVYEGNSWVQDHYRNTQGEFDQKKFSKDYEKAKIAYNYLADTSYDDIIKKQTIYHRDNIFVNPDKRYNKKNFEFIKIANPNEQTFGIQELGKVGERTKSIDELAQSHKVLLNPNSAGDNLENAEWGDAPNDSFFKYFPTTLVLAQYDSNGTHKDPITGEIVKHNKGDLKLNKEGQFYYEKLDGRDVYGRRVLNKMNVITTDGSFANKFDPFDSDDIEQKSIGGSILKNTALVGSMLLPYVGPWVVGLSIATQSASLFATLGKMLVGSESPTLNNFEGWSKSMNRQTAKTEYAQQNTWCWENFINLAGDVFAQIKEQRFIFNSFPRILKGSITEDALNAKRLELIEKYRNTPINNLDNQVNVLKAKRLLNLNAEHKANAEIQSFVKGYNKIGEILSKSYMTAITVGDTYGEAKAAGASDIEAAMLTLGYAAMEYKLLNTGIGEWMLPELRVGKYRNEAIAKAVTKLSQEADDGLKQFTDKVSKKDRIKQLFNIGKNIARAEYSNGSRALKATAASAVGEGVEEVSEEFLADFSKACYNTLQWLRDKDSRINSFGYDFEKGDWNISEIRDRYGMSLFGGFLGGGLANATNNYKQVKNINNMTSDKAIQEIVYMTRNNEIDRFLKDVDKTTLSNPNFSATNFTEKDGEIIYSPGTKDNNQDLYAKKAVHNFVDMVKEILNANGASVEDIEVLDRNTMKDIIDNLRYVSLYNSTTAGAYLNKFNSLTSDLVKVTNQINSVEIQAVDSNNDGVATDKEKRHNEIQEDYQKTIKLLKEQQKKISKEIEDLLSGKYSYDFISTALYEMTSALGSPTLQMYSEKKFGKKWSELTDQQKSDTKKEYEQWKVSDGRDQIIEGAWFYRDMAAKASNLINSFQQEYSKNANTIKELNNILSGIYTGLEEDTNAVGTANAITFRNLLDYMGIVYDENTSDADLVGIFVNNIGDLHKLINNIKDVGFINQESKNNLIQAIQSTTNILSKLFDPTGMGYEEQIDELLQLSNSIKNIPNTPVEKALEQFAITTTGQELNINQLLQSLNSSLKDFANDTSKLNFSDSIYQNLLNALQMTEWFREAIYGAKNDSAGLGNYYGYNSTLNEVSKKMGLDNPQLAEISGELADLFIADIDNISDKLHYFKALYELNQGRKLNKQQRVADLTNKLIFKRVRNIIDIPDNDPLKSWEGFSDLYKVIYEDCKLHNQELEGQQYNDVNEYEKENIILQDAIYEFFNKNLDKLEDPSKLIDFISKFNLYTRSNGVLSEGTTSLDDNTLLWWIASRAAIKSSDFYYMYKESMDNKLAPIYTQEQAVFGAMSAILNGNILDKFARAYKQYIKNDWKNKSIEDRKEVLKNLGMSGIDLFSKNENVDDVFNFIPTPKYSNTFLIEGIAGSGKTVAVITTIKNILSRFYDDLSEGMYIVHGGNEKTAESLLNKLQIKDGKSYGREKFMKLLDSSWADYIYDSKTNTFTINKNDVTRNSDDELVTTRKPAKTTNPPKVVFIDEIQKFSVYDMDLINSWAKENGVTIITTGDFNQQGFEGKHDFQTKSGDEVDYLACLDRILFPRIFKLGVSMRTDNSLKTSNQERFQAFMESPSNSDIELQYYLDDTGLYGDMEFGVQRGNNEQALLQLKSFTDAIDLMVKTLNKGEKIGYIFSDVNSPIYKYLHDKYSEYIDFKEGSSALGLEAQYYIIEADDNASYLKDVYTGLTRSQQGSILISFNNKVRYTNNRMQNKIEEPLNDSTIQAYADRRKQQLNKIISGGKIKYKSRIVQEKPLNKPIKNDDVTDNNGGSSSENDSDDPQTDNDLGKQEDIQEQSDELNETNVHISQVNNSDIDTVSLYTFNSFEIGVPDSAIVNGEIDFSNSDTWHGKNRIDGFNGLHRIFKFIHESAEPEKYDNYIQLLGQIQAVYRNFEDISEINRRLQSILGLQGHQCETMFALKASVRNGKGTNFYNDFKSPFSKGNNEHTIFNSSSDSNSSKCNIHQIVAILKVDGRNTLEVPITNLPSPITLLQMKENGNYVFQEYLDEFKKHAGKTLEEIKQDIQNSQNQEDARNKLINGLYRVLNYLETYNKSPKLASYLKMFLFTYNNILYINKLQGYETWTPSKGMVNLGSEFSITKGRNQIFDGYNFTNTKSNWQPVSEFTKDPSRKVSSKIMYYNGRSLGIKRGHPFVLISNNPLLFRSDEDLVKRFIAQEQDPNLPKVVDLQYLVAPTSTFSEYVDNLINIIHKKNNRRPIGQMFTAYRILNAIWGDIKDKYKQDNPKLAEKIEESLNLLNGVDNKEKLNLLKTETTWDGVNHKPQPLDRLLCNSILRYVVDRNFDIINNKYVDQGINQSRIDEISNILNNKGLSIFYNPKTLKNSQGERQVSSIDQSFVYIDADANYCIDRKPYMINGKRDSYVYETDLSYLINQFFLNYVVDSQGKHGSEDMKDYISFGKSTTQSVNYVKFFQDNGLDPSNIDNNDFTSVVKAITKINSENNGIFIYVDQNKNLIIKRDSRLQGNLSILADDGNGNITSLAYFSTILNKQGILVVNNNGSETKYNIIVENNGQLTLEQINVSNNGAKFNTDMDQNYSTFVEFINIYCPGADVNATLNELIDNLDEDPYIDSVEDIINEESISEDLWNKLANMYGTTDRNIIAQKLFDDINTFNNIRNDEDQTSCPIKFTL